MCGGKSGDGEFGDGGGGEMQSEGSTFMPLTKQGGCSDGGEAAVSPTGDPAPTATSARRTARRRSAAIGGQTNLDALTRDSPPPLPPPPSPPLPSPEPAPIDDDGVFPLSIVKKI